MYSLASILTLLATANMAFAAQAVVNSFASTDCSGNARSQTILVSASNSVGCAVTLNGAGAGSAQVTGFGCKTFFFADTECKSNFFGGNNPVPNSNCFRQIGSYSIQC